MQWIKKMFPFKWKRMVKDDLGVPSLHSTLQNLRRIGFYPSTALDVGAYEGLWAKDFIEVFPKTNVLMLEAQEEKEEILRRLSKKHPNLFYHIGLVTATENKEVFFYKSETASHVTSSETSGTCKFIGSTLDNIVKAKLGRAPEFVKLDVQGYELEVLKGGLATLEGATFCLLEVSLLDLSGEPSFTTVIEFMDKQGFQAYDICQFMRRPFDKALYQIDMLFIKKESEFIKSKRWN